MWEFLLAGCAVFFISSGAAAAESFRQSVVKVYVTQNGMDYYHPWQSKGSRSGSGSGFIIDGNRILTNAHVVGDATFIQVRKESDPRKYPARIVAIGYDCDLAEIKVDDPAFFSDTVPLTLGGLPESQDNVTVLGFPTGGDKLSITEGVVSRVEVVPYTESDKRLLAVQIDAAINPGNSGGPVILDGKLVGVAMQVRRKSQNIGYMIPVPILQHFLTDLKDGTYDGFPQLGIAYHDTENTALREYYGAGNLNGGVLVSWVQPFSSADGVLKAGDWVYEIGGVPIGVDGTFEFRSDERLRLSYLIHSKQLGETIPIKFIRDKKELTRQVKLRDVPGLVKGAHYFKKPPYYLYGGFLFTVLSRDLLESWGSKWWEKAPLDFMQYLLSDGRLNLERKKDIVVLLRVFPDISNMGYHGHENEVISRFNGQPIDSFEQFVKMLENNKNEFSIFETSDKFKIIARSRNIPRVTRAVMERNSIPRRFSPDVARWLHGQRPLTRDTLKSAPRGPEGADPAGPSRQ